MNNKTKIAVVGLGNWGKNLIRVCSELGVLAAIYDRDHERANQFAQQYNVASLAWPQILADSSITAVIVALPAVLHEEYAIQALNSNKHVFVEKPLAMDVDVARSLNLTAKNNKKVLMVGHILQYHNAYLKLKELIAEGLIGDIKYIESTRLHMGPIRYDAGIVWELLPHDISMLLGISNATIKNITVNQQNIYTNNYISYANPRYGDVIDININFSNGTLARVYSSWLHPRKEQKFWVAGTKGMLVFEDTENWDNKLKLYEYNSPNSPSLASEQKIALTPLEPLKAEISHFISSINKGEQAITNGDEGTRVVNLLQQIELKLRTQEKQESFA